MMQFILQDQIDLEKWDRMCEEAKTSSVFNRSELLQSICHWNAIVLDDYKGAIALPSRKRSGLKVLYQPPFIQHCSWVGQELNKELLRELEVLIHKNFHKTHFNSKTDLYNIYSKPRLNLILDLNNHYDHLKSNYSKSLRKNLKKSEGHLIQVSESTDVTSAISIYREVYGAMNPHIQERHYQRLHDYLLQAISREHALVLKVERSEKVLAHLVFLRSKDRFHYIMGAPNTEGRAHNALSFALDHLIRSYSGQAMVLDFEGSSIENVAQFYRSFGATEEYFNEIKYTPNPVLRLLGK